VYAILMPLQAERDLRLALPAEEHNFVQNLVWILIRIFEQRMHQAMTLLQDRRRFDLIHEAVFTPEGITHGAAHMGFHCPPIFLPVKNSFDAVKI
jgi:hypothetical protein